MKASANLLSSIFGLKTADGLEWIVSYALGDPERIFGEGFYAMGIITKKIKIPNTNIVLFNNPDMVGIDNHRDNLYDFHDAILKTREVVKEQGKNISKAARNILLKHIEKIKEENEAHEEAVKRRAEEDKNPIRHPAYK